MEKMNLNDKDLEQVAGGVGGYGVISSGSFASSTGTQLNIVVNWSVCGDGYGQKTLYVDVCASSYSLYTSGGGVELTVNGMPYWATAASVSYGGSAPAFNTLASFSVPNVNGAMNVSAVWHFNGSYSGVPLGDIRAGGVVTA